VQNVKVQNMMMMMMICRVEIKNAHGAAPLSSHTRPRYLTTFKIKLLKDSQNHSSK
jgi:hypothetical protein